MVEALTLGALQGVVEWLPVSSQGVTSAVYLMLWGADFERAVGFGLWLHLGTAPAAVFALRREAYAIWRETVSPPRWPPPPSLRFLALATLASAVAGLPLLAVMGELSNVGGSAAAFVVGALTSVMGVTQLRTKALGERGRSELDARDALLTGAAQGLSVIPGLSRSGLTVAALVSRRVERSQALAMSYLLSVPVSVGAGVYFGVESGFALQAEALAAACAAGVVGFIVIRALMSASARVEMGWFTIGVGALMAVGALAGLAS